MPVKVGPQAQKAWSCVTGAEKSNSDCTGPNLCLYYICAVTSAVNNSSSWLGMGVVARPDGGLMDLSQM